MKVLKNVVILIVILAAIFYFVPGEYWSFYLGKYYELTGNMGEALTQYENAAEANPENVKFVQAYARTTNDLAEELEEEDRYNDAYHIADKWIDDHQNHDQVHLILIELARAEWGRERKNQAKQAIDLAVRNAPTNYEALVYQGIIYRDISDTESSIRLSIPIFEEAIKVRNFKSTYWAEYELARAWWKIHDETRALVSIEQALSQFPPRWLRDDAERLKQEINSGGRSER